MAAPCSPSGRFAGGSRRQRPKELRWSAAKLELRYRGHARRRGDCPARAPRLASRVGKVVAEARRIIHLCKVHGAVSICRHHAARSRRRACSDLRLGRKLLSDTLGNEALGERTGGRLLPRARPSRTRRREASPNHCAQRTRILEWVVDSSDGGSGIAIMRQSFALRRQQRLVKGF
jgi:hypothetical protein